MPDNLRVTVPISPNDSISRMKPQKEPSAVDVVAPERVPQPNQKEQANQGNAFDAMLGRDSVFTKFVQQLRQTPALSETLQKIMFDIFNRKDSIRAGGSVNALLRQLTEGMAMNREEILQNLMFQQANTTKFSGPVFELLRELQRQYKGTDLDLHLAKFLKAFDGFFSIPDTTNTIARELETIERQIPRSSAEPIRQAAQELDLENPVPGSDKNLALLKEKIIPMLGEYVSRSNDFGRARDTITLLVHDIARLNLSSRDALVEKFGDLLDFCRYGLNMPEEQVSRIQSLFAREIAKHNSSPQNRLVDSFLKLMEDGNTQQKLSSSSAAGQAIFRDVSTALLLDQSVYMPFTHLFLPVNYEGQFMFAEMWVEKDGHGGEKAGRAEAGKRILLTFDIRGLGSFEAVILINGRDVTMNLNCPSGLPHGRREIADNVGRILSDHGLGVNQLHVAEDRPLNVEKQVLQKIYEGKNAVDVTI